MECGMTPCRLFLSRNKLTSWVQLANEEKKDQSAASNWFIPRSSWTKLSKDPKDGTITWNSLLRKLITVRLVAFASEAGI